MHKVHAYMSGWEFWHNVIGRPVCYCCGNWKHLTLWQALVSSMWTLSCILLYLVISCYILFSFSHDFLQNSINVSCFSMSWVVPNGSQDLIWGRSLRHWKPPPNRQRRQRRQHGERGNSVRSNLKFVHVRLPIWEQVVPFWVCWLLLVSTCFY